MFQTQAVIMALLVSLFALICCLDCIQGSTPGIPGGEPPEDCYKPHEVWVPCTLHCENTCENYETPNRICQLRCIKGCVCDSKNGYVRNSAGDCVKTYDCPKYCGKNEHWDPCTKPCPSETCATLAPGYKCRNKPGTPLTCLPDCVCNKGYLRNDNGKCVPKSQCPSHHTCGFNEVYSNCTVQCPPQTCESYSIQYNICDKPKCEPGCRCRERHVRDEYGRCIRSSSCPEAPQPCPANSKYDECTGPYEVNCDNYGRKNNNHCLGPCVKGCSCNIGFVKNNGACIKYEDCPYRTTTTTVAQSEESKSVADKSSSNSESHSENTQTADEDGTVEHHDEEESSHNENSTSTTATAETEEQ